MSVTPVFCCKCVANAVLHEGDLITFGHMQGEHLPPGTWQRQPDSDFQYIVSNASVVQFVLLCTHAHAAVIAVLCTVDLVSI